MTEPETAQSQDVADLAQRVRLVEVTAQELRIRRLSAAAPSRGVVTVEPGVALGTGSVDYRLELRCELFAEDNSQISDIFVAVAGHYTVTEGRELPEEAFHAYGNQSATPELYPYVRQHVQDLAARTGLPTLTLAPLRQVVAEEEAPGATEG